MSGDGRRVDVVLSKGTDERLAHYYQLHWAPSVSHPVDQTTQEIGGHYTTGWRSQTGRVIGWLSAQCSMNDSQAAIATEHHLDESKWYIKYNESMNIRLIPTIMQTLSWIRFPKDKWIKTSMIDQSLALTTALHKSVSLATNQWLVGVIDISGGHHWHRNNHYSHYSLIRDSLLSQWISKFLSDVTLDLRVFMSDRTEPELIACRNQDLGLLNGLTLRCIEISAFSLLCEHTHWLDVKIALEDSTLSSMASMPSMSCMLSITLIVDCIRAKHKKLIFINSTKKRTK